MAGIFPFIINSLLGGMLGNQGNMNMMSGNQGNNNGMDILNGIFGNQSDGSAINGMKNSGVNSNNDVMSMLNGILGNQGNLNNFNGTNNNYNNNDVINMLNGILSNQSNINMSNGNNNNLGNRNNSNKRNSSNTKTGLEVGLTKNTKRNKRNNNRRNNSVNEVNNEFLNTFNEIFNQTFAAVVNNQDIIENIVDTVLNSDIVGSMISEIEKIDGMNIELKDYDDKYLVEGKLYGINKKDIDLDYEDETLTVKVKNNQIFTNGRNTIVGIVQPNADIEKKFVVNNVDANRISAVFKEDILRVYLPKKQNAMGVDTIIDVDNYILD